MKRLSPFIFLILASCGMFDLAPVPYLVTGLTVISGEGDEYRLGAVDVTVFNQGEREIIFLDLDFDLYDTAGYPQPRIGSNRVKARFRQSLPPGEEVSFRIVLDSLFNRIPSEPLTLTRFCITEIGFSDGSVWADRLRLNLIMEDGVAVLGSVGD